MLEIRPIQRDEIELAREVITSGCFEFFGQPPADFSDMDDLEAQYSGESGVFLVLVDEDKVVGTGAIRRLEGDVCELKRMWFMPEYRGLGWGSKMATMLLESARQMGYRCVRLDTAPQQQQALRLYSRLGFQPIERYNDGPCELFMELTL